MLSIAGVITKVFLNAAKISAVRRSVSSMMAWISASVGPGPRTTLVEVVGAARVEVDVTGTVVTTTVRAGAVATVPLGWGALLPPQLEPVTTQSTDNPMSPHFMRSTVCAEMHLRKGPPHAAAAYTCGPTSRSPFGAIDASAWGNSTTNSVKWAGNTNSLNSTARPSTSWEIRHCF